MIGVRVSWKAEKQFPRPPIRVLRELLTTLAEAADAGLDGRSFSVTFLSSADMTRANWNFLRHKGDTDVICFDYRNSDEPETPGDADPDDTAVDLLVCPAVAFREARKRGLPYSGELTLYIAHGLLHAAGWDDLKPDLKRKMRRAERRTLGKLEPRLLEIFFERTEGDK